MRKPKFINQEDANLGPKTLALMDQIGEYQIDDNDGNDVLFTMTPVSIEVEEPPLQNLIN